MAWQTIEVGFGGVILAVVLVTFVARHFSKPVLCLRDASAALQNGEFNTKQLSGFAKRKDELGDLARHL
jgi:nitrate/nitrite-specific signal transduction histidine kinase